MGDTTAGKRTTIAIGADHAGFALKEDLRTVLADEGYQLQDFGTFSTDRVDYPDIAEAVCAAVAAGQFERAILVCGTGIGMSMTANKIKGIRAAACSESYSAMMARKHNNANVICMGGRVVGLGVATEIAKAFLENDFEGGRHACRVDKINALDA
jgi:ribose 5-phosphate isomerase B